MTIIRSHISAAGCAKENALLPAAATAAFHPTDLFSGGEAGLVVIVGESAMYQNSGGTGAVADTDPVGRIDDLANSNNLLQATAGNRATYNESGAIKYLTGDGTSDILVAAATTIHNMGGDWTVVLVHKTADATQTDKRLASLGLSSSGNFIVPAVATHTVGGTAHRMRIWARTSNSLIMLNTISATTHFDAANWSVTTSELNGTTDWTWRLNAANEETFSVSNADAGSDPNNFAIFGIQKSTPANWFNGSIAAVFSINRLLTSTERANLETYFGNLVGLSI